MQGVQVQSLVKELRSPPAAWRSMWQGHCKTERRLALNFRVYADHLENLLKMEIATHTHHRHTHTHTHTPLLTAQSGFRKSGFASKNNSLDDSDAGVPYPQRARP